MKILTRYALKELLGPFLFGIALFTFIFVSDKLFDLVDLLITRGVPMGTVGLLFLYILPSIAAVTIPMSWLFGNLMAFGRLTQDHEILALAVSGVSPGRLGRLSFGIALVLSVGMTWFNDQVLPRANWAFTQLYFDIIRQRATIVIQPQLFISEFEGYVFRASRKDDRTGELEGLVVFVLDQAGPRQGAAVQTITASHGHLLADPASRRMLLKLSDGEIHDSLTSAPSGGSLAADRYWRIKFTDYDIPLHAPSDGPDQATKSLREMTFDELAAESARRAALKMPVQSALLEWHKRIAIPFACLAFALVGFPLGTLIRRGGRGVGFSMSLILIFIYYLLQVLGETLGEQGRLPPAAAMWLPNLLVAVVGLVLTRRLFKGPRS